MKKIVILIKNQKDSVNDNILKAFSGKDFPEIFVTDSLQQFKKLEDLYLIYDSDELSLQKVGKEASCEKTDFGFNENADFKASDETINGENIYFKINFKGNSVPIWFKNEANIDTKIQIYKVLPVVCLGDYLGLNMLEVANSVTKL